jgi:hypothetical protein
VLGFPQFIGVTKGGPVFRMFGGRYGNRINRELVMDNVRIGLLEVVIG